MMSSVGDRKGLTTVHGRTEDDYDDYADDRGALIAPKLARALVGIGFCCFASVALLWVVFDLESNVSEVTLAVACLSGLLVLQYFYFCRPGTNLHSPLSYGMLVAQAGLAYLPLAVFGASWISQPSFLAGSVLLVLPLRAAWPMYAVVVASTGFAQYLVNGVWRDVGYILVNTATAGLFVYGLTRLARLVTALHEARDELAKTAVAHERLRFARDLHDLLGLSLSAIAPKGELTLRLVRRNPGRAKQELSEILEIARRALADVRAIARLYREISLNDETTTLATMLAASNVDLRVDLELSELPPHTRTALSAVLRESVAYVLRHREGEHCEIVLGRQDDTVSVDIVNDLSGYESAGVTGAGDDTDNLSTMVSRMAGILDIGTDARGRLRLHVTIPVTARAPGHPAEAADEPRESIPQVATKLATGLVVAVFIGLFVQAVLRLFYLPEVPGVGEFLLTTAYLVGALVLQLAYFSRLGTQLRSRQSYLLLVLMAILVCLPTLQFQQAWAGLPGFLAGSALLVLRPALGWLVYFAVVAFVAWIQIQLGTGIPRVIGQQIFITVNLGLITYGLIWMARTVRQLRAARQELAEVALAETRLRFARDLHDLLGLSLSAITLKSELAYRLMLLDPSRARGELVEVLDIARHALADVRSVASGYHEMSLEEECRTAESLLATAGLDVRMDVLKDTSYDNLPPDVSTVLATVLREGVTNVLRHSKGERCEITIDKRADEVYLHIVNDGVTETSENDHWGSGIRNMSDRVAAHHGVLTAGFEGEGRFGLCARIPLRVAEPAVATSVN